MGEYEYDIWRQVVDTQNYLIDFQRHINANLRDAEHDIEDDIKYSKEMVNLHIDEKATWLVDQLAGGGINIPAIIQGIIDGIRSLINQILTAVAGVAAQVLALIQGYIGPLLDALATSLKKLYDWVDGWMVWVWHHVQAMLNWLWAVIEPKIAWVKDQITNIITWLWNQIEPKLKWLWDTLEPKFQWVKDQLKIVMDDNTGLVLLDLGNLGDNLNTSMSTLFSDTLTPVAEAIQKLWEGLLQYIQDNPAVPSNAIGAMIGSISPTITGAIDDIKEVQLFNKQEEIFSLDRIDALYHSPPNYAQLISEAEDLQDLALRGYVGSQIAALLLDCSNPINGLQAKSLVESYMSMAGLQDYASAPRRIRYQVEVETSLRYAYQHIYTPMIPGAQDLVRFVVREYFSHGVGTGSPAEFADHMAYQGYSSKWAEAFWWSHWELPPANRLYDAFHRGIIDQESLQKYLTWHDFMPTPRPDIQSEGGQPKSDVDIMLETAYEQLGRIDIRRAYDMGRLDPGELKDRYMRLGYNEDDAQLEADISVEWILTEEKNKLRNEYILAFTNGMINEATLRVNLTTLNMTQKVVDMLVNYAKGRHQREVRDKKADAYSTAFRVSVLSGNEYISHLSSLGYTSEAINDMLAIEKIKQTYTVPFAVEKVKPAVTQKEMMNAYASAFRKGAITESKFREELTDLAMTPEDINAKVEVEKAKALKAPPKEKEEIDRIAKLIEVNDFVVALSTQYRKNVIDVSTFMAELGKLNVDPDYIAQIVKLENVKKGLT
jgi:hypothetical protein